MANLRSVLGYRIRSLRKSSGLSQEQLGELANLHNTYIGAIERGERNPSLKSLERIAEALKIKVGDLFKFMDYELNSSEERMKAEIFFMLENKDAKTINFVLDLVRYVLKELGKFIK